MLVQILIISILADVDALEAVAKPKVTLWPNSTKILARQSVTLTCNVDSADQKKLIYYWYKDHQSIKAYRKTYIIWYANSKDTGSYWCKTQTSPDSDRVQLNVYDYVFLEAPATVYEGDFLKLSCRYRPGYYMKETTFYKDSEIIKRSETESDLYMRADGNTTGTYGCYKRSYRGKDYFDSAYILVKELFSVPEIKVTPYPVTEGDSVTLTCDTKRNRDRWTQILFGFYINGQNVSEFGASNEYRIHQVRSDYSGDYKCAAKTTSGTVHKTSENVNIQIQGKSSAFLVPSLISLIVLLILLASAVLAFKYRHKMFPWFVKEHRRPPGTDTTFPKSQDRIDQRSQIEAAVADTPDEEPTEYMNISRRGTGDGVGDGDGVCYTYLNMGRIRKNASDPTTANGDFSVTYSTVKCADTTSKTQKAASQELTDSPFCIYENFSCK